MPSAAGVKLLMKFMKQARDSLIRESATFSLMATELEGDQMTPIASRRCGCVPEADHAVCTSAPGPGKALCCA